MKMLKLTFTICAMCVSVSFAQPVQTVYLKQVKEINLIMQDKVFINAFGLTEPTKTISNVLSLGNSSYEITVAGCVGSVKVEYNGLPSVGGPTETIVIVGDVTCFPGGFSVGNQ